MLGEGVIMRIIRGCRAGVQRLVELPRAVRLTLAFAGALFLSVVGPAVEAWAAVSDPTNGAAASISTQLVGWIGTYGIPMLVAVMLIGLIIRVLVKLAHHATASV